MKKYYTMTVTALSPVHIASGIKINKLEYLYSKESNTVYVIDMVRLSDFLIKRKLMNIFIDRIQSGDQTFSLSSFFNEKAVSEQEYKQLAAYCYKNNNISVSPNQMEISEFVKDAYGCPYVPGSSVKGALRNALAYSMIMDKSSSFSNITKNITYAIRPDNSQAIQKNSFKEINRHERDLNTQIFHTLERKKKKNIKTGQIEIVKKDILNDCMSGLLISDSKPLDKESLILCQKTDLNIEGDTHSINILRECVEPGTKIVFDVGIDTELFPFRINDIADHLGHFYEDYDAVFRSIFINDTDDIVYEPQKTAGSEYIYLGGGTGFPLKTVIYSLFQDPDKAAQHVAKILDYKFSKANHISFTRKERVSPKVMKCTTFQGKLYEMGRCEISFKEKNK